MSLNKVILIGNLGTNPIIRTTQDGKEIANFSLATSEKWKNKTTNEKNEKTEWHKIIIFSPGLIKLTKDYLRKGSKIYLEGQLQTRKWQDQKGIDRYSTEIILKAYTGIIKILSSKSKEEISQQESSESEEYQELDNEIPF